MNTNGDGRHRYRTLFFGSPHKSLWSKPNPTPERRLLEYLDGAQPGEEKFLSSIAKHLQLSINALQSVLATLDMTKYLTGSGESIRLQIDNAHVRQRLIALDAAAARVPETQERKRERLAQQYTSKLGSVTISRNAQRDAKRQGLKRITEVRLHTRSDGFEEVQGRVELNNGKKMWVSEEHFDAAGLNTLAAAVYEHQLLSRHEQDEQKRLRRVASKEASRRTRQRRPELKQQQAVKAVTENERQKEKRRALTAEEKEKLKDQRELKKAIKQLEAKTAAQTTVNFNRHLYVSEDDPAYVGSRGPGQVQQLQSQERKVSEAVAQQRPFPAVATPSDQAEAWNRTVSILKSSAHWPVCATCGEHHPQDQVDRYALNLEAKDADGQSVLRLPQVKPMTDTLLGNLVKVLRNRHRCPHLQQPLTKKPKLQALRKMPLMLRSKLSVETEAPEHPAGLNEDLELLNICQTCHERLSKGKLPARALENNLWVGPIPDVLKNLTIAERLCLAPARLQIRLLHLSLYDRVFGRDVPDQSHRDLRRPDQHAKIKGNAIFLPQDPVALYNTWPLRPEELHQQLYVTFLSKDEKLPENLVPLERVIGVRRSVLKAAIEYLVNNPSYQEV